MRQVLAVTASSFALVAAAGVVTTASAAQSFGDLAVANDTHGDEHYNLHVEKTQKATGNVFPSYGPHQLGSNQFANRSLASQI
ncbi:hypothetical protein AAHZ94_29135 [Streptomyces sp. HSW2009]